MEEKTKKYEVNVRFPGSDGWRRLSVCETRKEAEEEIEWQKSDFFKDENKDCEFEIFEI